MYKYIPRETEKKASVFYRKLKIKNENISKLKPNKKNKTMNYNSSNNRSKNNEKNIKINNNNMNNSFY